MEAPQDMNETQPEMGDQPNMGDQPSMGDQPNKGDNNNTPQAGEQHEKENN
jgi:hypothetical protein